MDRRDFLKQSVGSGVVGLAGGAVTAGAIAGCATTGLHAPALVAAAVDMDAYVAQIDSYLDAIHHPEFARSLIGEANPATGPVDEADAREALTRSAIASMTVTGMYQDLDERDRAHPAMQTRLWESLAEMDQAVWGVHDMLTTMPQAERQALRAALRGHPTLTGGLANAIDTKAELIQLPAKTRHEMRRMIGQVGWRLREQDPSLLIDDVLGKVSRGAQRSAQTTQDPSITTTMAPIAISAAGPTARMPRVRIPPTPRQNAQRRMLEGASSAGFGGGIGLLTGVLTLSPGAVVFGLAGICVGAVLVVIGLIYLLVGGIRLHSLPAPPAPQRHPVGV